tara:strand:+ start:2326 stop:3084 length:759 start_codon:yes stop_codon:yes gene_type:complete
MSKIIAHDMSMSYPVLTNSSLSLKKKIINYLCGKKSSLSTSSLDNITFTLYNGDRLGLIGINGAGKSTLLKLLSGIYTPNTGSLIVNGNVSSLLSLQYGMKLWATGYENIRLRCLLNNLNDSQIEKITKEIEDFTELGDALEKPVNTYSSGMTLRLSFAIATSLKPDILILDEVIGTGDNYFLDKANARMKSFIQHSSVMVLASHSEQIIRQFCNKVLWLDKGVVRGFGCTDEVFKGYKSFIENKKKIVVER